MKITTHKLPESSFLSVDKDISLICDKVARNKRLQKYLYYNTSNPLAESDLTEEEINSMFGKQIKIVPKFHLEGEAINYIIISSDTFVQNANNPAFTNSLIELDIICHYDNWQLKDFELRPYKIAAELHTMLMNERLSGLGEVTLVGGTRLVLSPEYAGLCLIYEAIHGIEDKKNMPNPQDQVQFELDFNELFNQK